MIVLKFSLKLGKVVPPDLLFFLKIALSLQSLLWFHENFRVVLSIFAKTALRILMGIALDI